MCPRGGNRADFFWFKLRGENEVNMRLIGDF